MRGKQWIAAVLLCISAVLITACKEKAAAPEGENAAKAEYIRIDAKEAKRIMDEEEDVIILDVRTKEEYEEKHIKGAILIPNEDIKDTPPERLPLDGNILVYCRSGNRSEKAAKKLIAMGYENVRDFGGINSWDYETESGAYDPEAQSKNEAASSGELTGEFKAFESIDLDGNQVNQDVLLDADLTVLNLWGTFCGPCIQEMPELGELAEEYDGKGVQIIGVPVDVVSEDLLADAKEIVDMTGANYLHLLPTQDLYDIYLNQVRGVPETVFIDRTGTIVRSEMGARNKEDWKAIIDETYEKLQK